MGHSAVSGERHATLPESAASRSVPVPAEGRRIARVVLDSPLPQLDRLFDYALPDGFGEVACGVRVKVPLRTAGRVIDGYIAEIAMEADHARALSEIDSVVSSVAVMPERLMRLARRVADRAAGSASDVLRLVIPKRQVRVEKAWTADAPHEMPGDDAAKHADAVLKRYTGLAELIDEGGRAAVSAMPSLVDGEPAWTALLAAAAVRMLRAGRSTVIAVPDHRDLDRLLTALEPVIPATALVRLDARQTNPDRYRAFLRTLEDAPAVVIGNRSAVYTPMRAGLVVIWDDGDPLLAEPLAPYVHARDAALLRQEEEQSALLLVGHTRSTDAERLVAQGWLQDLGPVPRLSPRVQLSTPQELEQHTQRLPSSAFLSARSAAAEGPVLVQVARPGFSPSLVCADCRRPARCLRCGGPLGAHRRGAVPVCGWCGVAGRAWQCPECSSAQLRLASSGSERTADELGRAFPGVRVILADGAHPVERVDDRPALVVATRGAEPIADGGYRAVVLLDGARMLQAPQLRIAESCLRWWSNAAALAAPGAPVHLVGVDGRVARALATWSQPAYARTELAERAPLRMPPTARVAQIDGRPSPVGRALDELRAAGVPAEAILGPLPLDADDGTVRALVRFEYAAGAKVAGMLRAAVVAEAVQRRRGKGRSARPTLTVRLDILEPEL